MTRRVCDLEPSRMALTIGVENRMGRSFTTSIVAIASPPGRETPISAFAEIGGSIVGKCRVFQNKPGHIAKGGIFPENRYDDGVWAPNVGPRARGLQPRNRSSSLRVSIGL